MKNKELEFLKKKYGENFARLCRELFPTILEHEGELVKIISKNFYESKFLYEDLKTNDKFLDFKNFVFSKYSRNNPSPMQPVIEDPYVLMKKAGYTLYKCNNDFEIQEFKKYWHKGEELCTFNDYLRTQSNLVFFAIKDNIDEIRREDFTNPLRQDTYGTSAISLQFTRTTPSTLSIKNRYNHKVKNPDATFSNDLENIIAGLTDSFAKHFNIDFISPYELLDIPNYVRTNDGMYLKYNYTMRNSYYCPDNIFINSMGQVIKYDKDKHLLLDYFILDLQNNTLSMAPNMPYEDSFIDAFTDIKKVQVSKNGNNKIITLTPNIGNDIFIEIDNTNKIIAYENSNITTIGDRFLLSNKELERLSLPSLQKVGGMFLYGNINLRELSLPQLTHTSSHFLNDNEAIIKLELPNLTTIKNRFMFNNRSLVNVNLPKLTEVGSHFLYYNNSIEKLSLPNLSIVFEEPVNLQSLYDKNKINYNHNLLSNHENRKHLITNMQDKNLGFER